MVRRRERREEGREGVREGERREGGEARQISTEGHDRSVRYPNVLVRIQHSSRMSSSRYIFPSTPRTLFILLSISPPRSPPLAPFSPEYSTTVRTHSPIPSISILSLPNTTAMSISLVVGCADAGRGGAHTAAINGGSTAGGSRKTRRGRGGSRSRVERHRFLPHTSAVGVAWSTNWFRSAFSVRGRM